MRPTESKSLTPFPQKNIFLISKKKFFFTFFFVAHCETDLQAICSAFSLACQVLGMKIMTHDTTIFPNRTIQWKPLPGFDK